jgi:hypothetical protein
MRTFIYGNARHSGPALTLRIHSNIYDKNGQPIFSILRICRDETFGPRLDAYCANRGKEYGKDWMFVYRYEAITHQNPRQEMSITLTWDMTPNDVKGDDCPGMAMQNLDTIYVMQTKASASTKSEHQVYEGGAVQSSEPQAPHIMVDITNGETNTYQDSDVSRQWYQAVEQDSARLRASHAQMKSTIIQQQQQIFAKDKYAAEQQAIIDELTSLSKQVRERLQNPLPDPTAPVADSLAPRAPSLQAPAGRVIRQRPGPPAQHMKQQAGQQALQQAAQQRSKANPTAFVVKCEAVRDPEGQAPQHLEPLQFPSLTGGFEISDYTHQPNMNAAHNTQIQSHGRIRDAADKVAGENGGEGVNKEQGATSVYRGNMQQ